MQLMKMMSIEPSDLILMIEQQEKALEALLPAYRAHVEEKQRAIGLSGSVSARPATGEYAPHPTLGAGAPAKSESHRGHATAGLGVQAMLSQAQSLVGTKTAKSTPELAADPLLFKTALTQAGEEWDSIRATEGGRMDIFIRRLPNYSTDSTRGSNTVVLRAQMLSLAGFDRQFAAINIGRAPSEREAASSLSRDVLAHVYWRVDPVKLGREDSFKYRFGQTFKQGGRWSNDMKKERAFGAMQWPFKTDKPFYVRLILDPRGVLSYVDGKFFSYTMYPAGSAPAEGDALYLQLPVAGDAGEKPTWKALSAHWGSCRADADAERSMAEFFASPAGAAAFASMKVESEDELYLTGVPPACTERDVMEAFRAVGAVAAAMDTTRQGAAKVKLSIPPGQHISAVVKATDRIVLIAGTAVNVKRSLVSFRHASAAVPHAGAGAGAPTMHVGFAPFTAGSHSSSAAQYSAAAAAFGPATGLSSHSTGSGGPSSHRQAGAGVSTYSAGAGGPGSGTSMYHPTSPP